MKPFEPARTWYDWWVEVRRSFSDFLLVPGTTVAAFLLAALAVCAIDRPSVGWAAPLRGFLQAHIVTDARATGTLLATLAGGLITLTSITFSLMLIALQQSAATLTAQVIDQFVRRRMNQIFFGGFVGCAVFVLVVLARSDGGTPPVLGVIASLVVTVGALGALIVQLYVTLNQMRPHRIVEAIHDLTLAAREREARTILDRTRRRPALTGPAATTEVRSDANGYVAQIDLDRIGRIARRAAGEVEVRLRVSLGDYVCVGDLVAEVAATQPADSSLVCPEVRDALGLERERDLQIDSGYGIEQLTMIGWTSVSTSKSNPSPGLAALHVLRDLLARWTAQPGRNPSAAPALQAVPVVYRDRVVECVFDAFESFAVAASESMQHQSCLTVLDALAKIFGRLPASGRRRSEDLVCRIISMLGDHVLTMQLDHVLTELTRVLEREGAAETAGALARAHDQMRTSVGVLNSRATRVPAA
jgi:uncharacterized membrane protein